MSLSNNERWLATVAIGFATIVLGGIVIFQINRAPSPVAGGKVEDFHDLETTPQPGADTHRIEALPPLGQCAFSQGTGAGTIVMGRLILESEHTHHSGLFVNAGLIQAIAAPEVLVAQHPDASVLQCTDAYISPGFINAHEHTSYSYTAPPASLQPYYVHRDEWRLGLNHKKRIDPPTTPDPRVLAWIELRHLLSGVTTLAGSGAVPGLVKNASQETSSEYSYRIDTTTFPFGRAAMERFSAYPCNADPTQLPQPAWSHGVPLHVPSVSHVGEGTDCTSDLEIDAYLHHLRGAPVRRHSLIHGLRIQSKHIETLRARDVTVIWSPRSNIALYGQTLDGSWLLDQDVRVALGTDWSPSGSFNIFQEMQCAMMQSKVASRALKGFELWRMITSAAAYSLGIEPRTGSLAVGKAADIVVLDGISSAELEDFGAQSPANVIAVFVDGALLAFDEQRVHGALRMSHCRHSIAGKRLCVDFSRYAFSFEKMLQRNRTNIGLFDLTGQATCNTALTQ